MPKQYNSSLAVEEARETKRRTSANGTEGRGSGQAGRSGGQESRSGGQESGRQ
ncbi:hypothetical protein NE236_21215 [Actinoallomurus purpureus]|uniref:hypothetical protein n=1 Tax=Actinoallomurus purpureus TaxID=478114 RepID=UPI002093378D|nr:hypothetical protein [Actinoallomurus purpureus]MCO6007502.1 hypothetical protein [Actinoallomurus purpureus]